MASGGMHGRGHVWQGACVAGGVHDGGACVAGDMHSMETCTVGACMQEGQPLKWTVHILLECILVMKY